MKTKVISVFRKDYTNVGDCWSPPHLYFPLDPQQILDLTELPNKVSSHDGLVIVGGGGLGRDNFRVHLNRLRSIYPDGKLVGWGVGTDFSEFDAKYEYLPSDLSLLGNYFEQFDLVKSRVWTPDQPEQWLPCVSAMHSAFDELRQKVSDVDVVIYSHKRRKIQPKAVNNFWKKNREFISLPRSLSVLNADNDGNDLSVKLATLARARVVITNSYHGVYWATLLGADSSTRCNKDEPGDGWLRMSRHHGHSNRQVQVARCTSTSAEKNDTKFTAS